MPAEPTHAQQITVWLNRVQNGRDESACAHLWQAYFERLILLARKQLRGAPQRVGDEEDVVLSVMDSFFAGVQQGRFPNLSDRNELWALLVTMTARKAVNQLRGQQTLKRGGGKNRGESAFGDPAAGEGGQGINTVAAPTPTPEFAVEVAESCRRRLASLGDEELVKVATMRLEGYTTQEIAERLNCSPRTVERRLEAIRRAWADRDPDN